MKKLVSIRAVIARLNRKLVKESKKLQKYKPIVQGDTNFDEYAVVDLKTNAIIHFHTRSEIPDFARSLGCLACLEDVSFE